MPYIKKEQRNVIDPSIEQLSKHLVDAGTINYAFTKLLHLYLKEKGLRYANLNTVIGSIECMKLELYARIGEVYELEKLKENGPVGVLDIETKDIVMCNIEENKQY